MSGLDPAIRSYYERRPEETRLARGLSQIEAARTKELVLRFAPDPPATVLDVGGAAGAYAFWLSARGYTVHLLDPVPRLVALASERSAASDVPLASAQVGDARSLPCADGCAQFLRMLLLLYYFVDPRDLPPVPARAHRALRPGGVLFAACITRWASLFDGVARDLLADPSFSEIVEEDLRTGTHRNPAEVPGYFTTAYFHRPEELEAELRAAGFRVEGFFGLEGPACLLGDFEARWADGRRREDLLRAAREVEREPALRGLSPHLLGVCRRPVG